MKYEDELQKFARNEFVGRFDRSVRDLSRVVAIGFLYLGGLLGGRVGMEENRGSRVRPVSPMDEEKEYDPDSANNNSDVRRSGPGRPRKDV